jgi:hypothetical protein
MFTDGVQTRRGTSNPRSEVAPRPASIFVSAYDYPIGPTLPTVLLTVRLRTGLPHSIGNYMPAMDILGGNDNKTVTIHGRDDGGASC